jgi:hypothetical protein
MTLKLLMKAAKFLKAQMGLQILKLKNCSKYLGLKIIST